MCSTAIIPNGITCVAQARNGGQSIRKRPTFRSNFFFLIDRDGICSGAVAAGRLFAAFSLDREASAAIDTKFVEERRVVD
jgi:hypothetical protein